MDNIISIDKLSFNYEKHQIFDEFSLNISKGTFTTIIGPNGSGKSTLVKLMVGLEKGKGKINILGLELSHKNIEEIIGKIGIVFENADDSFVAQTVMDEIAFTLENKQVSAKDIKSMVKEIASLLNISNILEKNPHTLSGGQKQIVALASALVAKPKILILDEAFTMLDEDIKINILKLLKEVSIREDMTVINVTHDVDDALYGTNIIVLDEGKVVLDGSKEYVFGEEKVFNHVGIKLPFMAELSIKLKYYGLIDHMIFEMDEMVDELWK